MTLPIREDTQLSLASSGSSMNPIKTVDMVML
jgi:hypothetical protein